MTGWALALALLAAPPRGAPVEALGPSGLAPVRAALSRHDDRTRLLALLSPT